MFNWVFFALLILTSPFLQGCAHSNIQRQAAGQIDAANTCGQQALCSVPDIGDTYQNANQATRSFWIGGAAGAITGGLASTQVGVLPGAVIGAILGGAVGTYIDTNTTLADRIQNQGVKVYILGDQVLFVIPSSNIFCDCSPCLRPGTSCSLDLIAQLISSYPNIGVHIAAYASPNYIVGERANFAITQRQAERVARYLWDSGINTRLLTTEGKGSTKLVQMTPSCAWDNENDRIEITLERLPC